MTKFLLPKFLIVLAFFAIPTQSCNPIQHCISDNQEALAYLIGEWQLTFEKVGGVVSPVGSLDNDAIQFSYQPHSHCYGQMAINGITWDSGSVGVTKQGDDIRTIWNWTGSTAQSVIVFTPDCANEIRTYSYIPYDDTSIPVERVYTRVIN